MPLCARMPTGCWQKPGKTPSFLLRTLLSQQLRTLGVPCKDPSTVKNGTRQWQRGMLPPLLAKGRVVWPGATLPSWPWGPSECEGFEWRRLSVQLCLTVSVQNLGEGKHRRFFVPQQCFGTDFSSFAPDAKHTAWFSWLHVKLTSHVWRPLAAMQRLGEKPKGTSM